MNNAFTNKSLLTLLFNANGLKNHVNELQTVLYDKRIDLALITETHFTQHSQIYIPGYKLLKTNHPDNTAHGGVAILIKSTIAFQALPNFCQDFLQSCAVTIHLNNIPITVAALYSPPRHNLNSEHFANYFKTINNNFIIGGDFNAKHQNWGCRVNNPRGIVLHNFVSTKNFKILAPPGPTYWPTSPQKSPDILDIFIAKIPSSLYCTTNNILDLNSDHSSVLLTINDYPSTHETPPTLFNTSTDRFKFHDIVNQTIKLNVKLKTNDDIDSAVNSLTNLIQSAARSSNSVANANLLSKNKFPLPNHIRMLIAEKRRARALYQRTHLLSHKQKYNSLANSLKKILAKNKSLSIANHLSNLMAKYFNTILQSLQ